MWQGRLSRHKVTVGEPAVGLPPIYLWAGRQERHYNHYSSTYPSYRKLKNYAR
jgi:hypothetical protein